MRVVVVGVCVAGKTTLVKQLRELGIDAYNLAQEHSCVKKLWQKKQPDILILLEATLPAIRKRRDVAWGEERLVVQRERLRDAKENADLVIQTDELSKEEVAQMAINFIRGHNDGNNCSGTEKRP